MAIILDGTNGISTPDVEPTGSTVPTNGLYLPAANSVGIATNSTNAVYINSSQNVGIGTSSPAQKLDVNGGARFATSQWVQFGTNNTFYADSSYGLIIKAPATSNFITFRSSNDTERMRIDSSGNVGIGTSSPGYKLDVVGTLAVRGDVGGRTLQLKQNTYGFLIEADTNATDLTLSAAYSAGYFAVKTAGSERMRIDSSGYLLINQTSNVTSSYLQIKGAQPAISCESTSTGSVSQVLFRNPNGQVGSIGTSGTSTSYNTSSDYRLKENIAPMTGALAKVAALNPVTYNWKVDGSAGQGFIAHELQAVVPDCVTGEKDAVDVEGKPQYQGVDTSFLVATLTAAIKEQQALIEQLTTRIAALEAK